MQVLASVPDLDIVAYLPLFLSSLMECLTDPLNEVRSKAAKVLQVAMLPAEGSLHPTGMSQQPTSSSVSRRWQILACSVMGQCIWTTIIYCLALGVL